ITPPGTPGINIDPHQALRVGKRQWPKQHRVHYGEDCEICANAERQSKNGDCRECRRRRKSANAILHVLPKSFHGFSPPELASRTDFVLCTVNAVMPPYQKQRDTNYYGTVGRKVRLWAPADGRRQEGLLDLQNGLFGHVELGDILERFRHEDDFS